MSEFTPITTQEEFDAALKDRLTRDREAQAKKTAEKYADYEDLKNKTAEYEKQIAGFKEQLKGAEEKDKKIESLTQQIANSKTAALFDNAKEVNGIKIVSARMDGSAPDALRKLGDSVKDKDEAIIALFAAVNGEKGTFYCVCTKEAIANGGNAGKIVREVSAVTGGKGGGKPDGAMAGAGDISKIDEAVAKFEDIVSASLK